MTLFVLEPGEDRELYEGDLDPDPVSESQARAQRDGREFDSEAFEYLEKAGCRILRTYFHVDGHAMDALVEGENGTRYYVDAHGTPDRTVRPQAGMRRQDTALKFGCKAFHWKAQDLVPRLLLVTSHMPEPHMSSAKVLRDLAKAGALWDAFAVPGDLAGFRRLAEYFTSVPPRQEPLPARWRSLETQLQLVGIGPPEAQEVN